MLPQIAGARKALDVLGSVQPQYLVAGTVLEILSVVAYAALTRSVLPPGGRPSLFTLLRIDATTLGVSHIVPGGAATAGALRFRLLHAAGVSGPDAAFGAAVQGVRLRDRAERDPLAGSGGVDPAARLQTRSTRRPPRSGPCWSRAGSGRCCC